MLMASLERALVTVASISPAMASSITFTTYWKAASPPSLVAPRPKGAGTPSFSFRGISPAGTIPMSSTSMVPCSNLASLGDLMPWSCREMPETFFATSSAYSMELRSPTTKGRQRR